MSSVGVFDVTALAPAWLLVNLSAHVAKLQFMCLYVKTPTTQHVLLAVRGQTFVIAMLCRSSVLECYLI